MTRLRVRDIVTFDLDSTLADTRHRHHMLQVPEGEYPDWDAYALACVGDTPVPSVVRMLKMVEATCDVWIVSGRSAAAWDETWAWLKAQDIKPSGMILDDGSQRSGHHMTHGAFKVWMVERVEYATGQDVAFHVDDWCEVGIAMEEAGRKCLIVTPPQAIARYAQPGAVLA